MVFERSILFIDARPRGLEGPRRRRIAIADMRRRVSRVPVNTVLRIAGAGSRMCALAGADRDRQPLTRIWVTGLVQRPPPAGAGGMFGRFRHFRRGVAAGFLSLEVESRMPRPGATPWARGFLACRQRKTRIALASPFALPRPHHALLIPVALPSLAHHASARTARSRARPRGIRRARARAERLRRRHQRRRHGRLGRPRHAALGMGPVRRLQRRPEPRRRGRLCRPWRAALAVGRKLRAGASGHLGLSPRSARAGAARKS